MDINTKIGRAIDYAAAMMRKGVPQWDAVQETMAIFGLPEDDIIAGLTDADAEADHGKPTIILRGYDGEEVARLTPVDAQTT